MFTTTGTSYTNTSANAGYTYYYKVEAVSDRSSYAKSAYSSTVARMCDCARPTATISLYNGKPRLRWQKVANADRYEVYRSTSKNGTYTKMFTTTATSYINTGARAGSTYYYKVRAICDRSSSATSAFSTAKGMRCV